MVSLTPSHLSFTFLVADNMVAVCGKCPASFCQQLRTNLDSDFANKAETVDTIGPVQEDCEIGP